jgi:predicted transcriptional regulator
MAKRILKSATVTARINAKLDRKLDKYAKVSGRTKSRAVEDILARYVDYETYVFEAVQEGIAAANRGELVPHEEVFRKIREKSAARRRALRKKAA